MKSHPYQAFIHGSAVFGAAVGCCIALGRLTAGFWGQTWQWYEYGVVGVVILGGWVMADFVSGLVHFCADTFGSPATPVVGKHLIALFRIHHDDPLDITRHGFLETNGNNTLALVPVLWGAILLCDPLQKGGWYALVGVLVFVVGIFGTNQFHKWAHNPHSSEVIAWLQRSGLILSPVHHAIHHIAPFRKHYCITTGWMNYVCDRVGVWNAIEGVVQVLRGGGARSRKGV